MKLSTILPTSKSLRTIATVTAITAVLTGAFIALPERSQSASLTSASVTLSNSRISFLGRLAATGNNEGSSIFNINTTPNATYPSGTTAQLRGGDVVIASVTENDYTVLDSNAPGVFRTTDVAATGDAAANLPIYSVQETDLTVRFTTATALVDGSFRVLIPAAPTDNADGIPDPGFFDFGASTPTVTCPSGVANYTFAAGTAQAAQTIGGNLYHVFTCEYTGNGAVGTNLSTTPMIIEGLVNPAPRAPRTNAETGKADSHVILIQHLDTNDVVQDATSVAVGVIEAVKITASVAPTINFTIAGVAASESRCGITTDVATTSFEVPFGVLDLNNFRRAAQQLEVSTNASGGYAITAVANDQLGLNANTCLGDNVDQVTCIQDARGDTGTMSHTVTDAWVLPASTGFGFTLADAGSPSFLGDGITLPFDSTEGWRQFADAEAPETAVNIASSTSVAGGHKIDVCYQIIPAVTNAAGEYQSSVTYTATATF